MRSLIVCVAILGGCSAKSGSHGDMSTAVDLSRGGLALEPTPPMQGNVMIWGYRFASGELHTSIAADFATSDGKPGPCSREVADGCSVEYCPRDDAGGQSSPNLTLVSGGMATLSGDGAPITFSTSGTADVNRSWSGGESLSLQVAGDVAPGFSASLTAPGRTNVLTPAMPMNGQTTVPVTRTVGFSLTWQPVSPGDMQVVLEAPYYTVTCTLPGDKGAYTVPPSALARLPADPVNASAGVVAATQTTAGAWPMVMTALAPANDNASGAMWAVRLSLQ
jgi:hypothetical protein